MVTTTGHPWLPNGTLIFRSANRAGGRQFVTKVSCIDAWPVPGRVIDITVPIRPRHAVVPAGDPPRACPNGHESSAAHDLR